MAQWKKCAEVQMIGMIGVGKNARETAQQLRHLQKRTVCHSFTAGRCRRGNNCKYAHVLPETAVVMKAANDEEQKERKVVKEGKKEEKIPLGQNECIHYQRGNCRYLNKCKLDHIPENYGIRPRSQSAGKADMPAKKDFQKPSKKVPGSLGVVEEETLDLPETVNLADNPLVEKEEIARMEEAAKNYPAAEQGMMEELKKMYVENLLGAGTWQQMIAAFRQKSDS